MPSTEDPAAARGQEAGCEEGIGGQQVKAAEAERGSVLDGLLCHRALAKHTVLFSQSTKLLLYVTKLVPGCFGFNVLTYNLVKNSSYFFPFLRTVISIHVVFLISFSLNNIDTSNKFFLIHNKHTWLNTNVNFRYYFGMNS